MPAIPDTINANGLQLYLVDESGAVLDEVTYTGADCAIARNGRTLKCRSQNVIGTLGLGRKGSIQKHGNLNYSISGTFKRRNITSLTGATGLGVSMMFGSAVVQGSTVATCRMTSHGRAIVCKSRPSFVNGRLVTRGIAGTCFVFSLKKGEEEDDEHR